MKVATILGTRPEIIRLSRVIDQLDSHVDHHLVHTGQNYDYELNEIFFEDLSLRKPDHFLAAAGENAAETIGAVIAKSDRLLREIEPDAVLILGDTNSCLAALSAKRQKIPVFHMEAGNRCFDQRVPEEINRKIVDHMADINLPYSDIAREYLLREGITPDRIIKTGSPMFEVLAHYKQKIDNSTVIEQLGVAPGQYYVVSCHREENIESDQQFDKLIEVLTNLARRDHLPIIVSTHPRTRKRIDAAGVALPPQVRLQKPLCLSDYVHLEMHAKATLSDSGTITEESSILNFPALNIRDAHERPEGMEEAAVIMTGLDWNCIDQSLEVLDTQARGDQRSLQLVRDYQVPNVSDKVVRIILSYTSYINQTVWRQ